MFKSKQTSSFPWGWRIPPKKSHTKRNALIITGASALMLGVAGVINKKSEQQ